MPVVTTTECEVCTGAGWILLPGKDNDNFPNYRGCHNCAEGRPRFLAAMGFAENERIEPFEAFDVRRQRQNVDTTAKAWDAARAWSMDRKHNLVLSGPIGVGKTHLAKAATYHAGLTDHRPYFITGASFDSGSKNFDLPSIVRERWMQNLIERPRLAFDDIGFGGRDESAFMRAQLETLFDGRYRRDLGTLLTTNLTRDEFANYAGVRVLDRLMQDGEWLYMPGTSQRTR